MSSTLPIGILTEWPEVQRNKTLRPGLGAKLYMALRWRNVVALRVWFTKGGLTNNGVTVDPDFMGKRVELELVAWDSRGNPVLELTFGVTTKKLATLCKPAADEIVNAVLSGVNKHISKEAMTPNEPSQFNSVV